MAPIMTLSDHDLKMLNDSAIKIIRELKIEGGCNVQFALNPNSFRILPHRGQPQSFPLLRPGLQGLRLPHRPGHRQDRRGHALWRISRSPTPPPAFEPSLDYVVAKLPRFPFDKFASAKQHAGHPDEGHRRGHGHRRYPGGMPPEVRPFSGNRRVPLLHAQVRPTWRPRRSWNT